MADSARGASSQPTGGPIFAERNCRFPPRAVSCPTGRHDESIRVGHACQCPSSQGIAAHSVSAEAHWPSPRPSRLGIRSGLGGHSQITPVHRATTMATSRHGAPRRRAVGVPGPTLACAVSYDGDSAIVQVSVSGFTCPGPSHAYSAAEPYSGTIAVTASSARAHRPRPRPARPSARDRARSRASRGRRGRDGGADLTNAARPCRPVRSRTRGRLCSGGFPALYLSWPALGRHPASLRAPL